MGPEPQGYVYLSVLFVIKLYLTFTEILTFQGRVLQVF